LCLFNQKKWIEGRNREWLEGGRGLRRSRGARGARMWGTLGFKSEDGDGPSWPGDWRILGSGGQKGAGGGQDARGPGGQGDEGYRVGRRWPGCALASCRMH
jgi:hypothetical protein